MLPFVQQEFVILLNQRPIRQPVKKSKPEILTTKEAGIYVKSERPKCFFASSLQANALTSISP